MFEKFAKTVTKTTPKTTVTLEATSEFLRALSGEGLRLSYAALTVAARLLGEDSSGQIPAQRGAKLVKSLPASLQPYVCRKKGGYAKGVKELFGEDAPEGLLTMPVITQEIVGEAVQTWVDAQ